MQAALKPAGPAVKPAAPTRRVAVAGATGRAPPATAEPRGPKESRIGKAPILVPAGATITLEDAYIKVKVKEENRTWLGRTPGRGREGPASLRFRGHGALPVFLLTLFAIPTLRTLSLTGPQRRAGAELSAPGGD
jgi:hypothetical protein